MSRKLAAFCLLALLVSGLAGLSDVYYENIPLEDLFRIYGVPEVPAYMVLGVEPGSAIPPIDDNGLSFSLSGLGAGGTVIPETFSLEIAPLLLYKRDITLSDYHRSPLFFNSRLSLATTAQPDGGRKASLGLRLKLLDQADPKGNFCAAWPDFHREYQEAQQAWLSEYLAAHPDFDYDEDALEGLMYQFDEAYGVNARIREMVEGNRDKWNKLRIELSSAVVAASPDSLAEHARFQAWQTWLSVSNSLLGSTTAQYIFCPSVRYFREEGEEGADISVPLRFVLKSALLSSYLEAQYTYAGALKESGGAAVLGLYFQLRKGLWVDYQASYAANFTAGTSNLSHNLKLKYTLPVNLSP